jgi:hypothetical protein
MEQRNTFCISSEQVRMASLAITPPVVLIRLVYVPHADAIVGQCPGINTSVIPFVYNDVLMAVGTTAPCVVILFGTDLKNGSGHNAST